MKARIHLKDGRWEEARSHLQTYLNKMRDDESAKALLASVSDGEVAAKKATQAQRAKLWTACTDAATQALRTASHSLEIRQQRADCSLAAGDIEGGVGDLT